MVAPSARDDVRVANGDAAGEADAFAEVDLDGQISARRQLQRERGRMRRESLIHQRSAACQDAEADVAARARHGMQVGAEEPGISQVER